MEATPPAPAASCCSPARDGGAVSPPEIVPASRRAAAAAVVTTAALPGGEFLMGCADGPYPADGEGPVRRVRLDGFGIAPTAVSNDEFRAFVEASGYGTEAERCGWSFVFFGLLPDGGGPTAGVVGASWWRQVHGASWRHPEGPGSGLAQRGDHPVVHVSHRDAVAYCVWAGTRLPTEAEWEYAARGGLEQRAFPWGDALTPGGEHRMNVWQGEFPERNSAEDGYAGTAPVGAFPPNGYGLFGMTGNVWEWCADRFSATYHRRGPYVHPTGPRFGSGRVLRGGSYLCHASYCRRYRVSARMGNTADSSAGNVGFRVAVPVRAGT